MGKNKSSLGTSQVNLFHPCLTIKIANINIALHITWQKILNTVLRGRKLTNKWQYLLGKHYIRDTIGDLISHRHEPLPHPPWPVTPIWCHSPPLLLTPEGNVSRHWNVVSHFTMNFLLALCFFIARYQSYDCDWLYFSLGLLYTLSLADVGVEIFH